MYIGELISSVLGCYGKELPSGPSSLTLALYYIQLLRAVGSSLQWARSGPRATIAHPSSWSRCSPLTQMGDAAAAAGGVFLPLQQTVSRSSKRRRAQLAISRGGGGGDLCASLDPPHPHNAAAALAAAAPVTTPGGSEEPRECVVVS